ncbi:MAG: hypothetical protein H7318_18170 [Oligoflexus sp.]|nr:hypothetical protein [Oligoflexus sp.]
MGRVDTENLGLSGYSFGAAGAVLAANQLKTEIKGVVAINAYRPALPLSEAPYLFVVGKLDTVAIASTVNRVFAAMDTHAPRAFAYVSALDHCRVLARGNKHQEIARMATAWLKNYIAQDSRYMTFINETELDLLVNEGQVFADASDYVFVSGE